MDGKRNPFQKAEQPPWFEFNLKRKLAFLGVLFPMVGVLANSSMGIKTGENLLLEKHMHALSDIDFNFIKENSAGLDDYFFRQQEVEITGVVTDQDGVPLPGVNITVEGTSQGTQSDFDGNYTIQVEAGRTLRFSFVGFQDQEIVAGDQGQVDIQMKEGNALNEVVISAFGRKTTRNESTASVITVSSEDIAETPFVSAQEALQGKAPGLTVNSTSGIPGSSAEIRIRGMNSLTAGNSPLYVIDGVPVNSGDVGGAEESTSLDLLSLVNPDDIESISVLKDASAVAPYGAEGSNGVILVTTKSGQGGKTRFNLNYRLGITNMARDKFKAMNADQRYQAVKLGILNGYADGAEMSDGEFEDFALNELHYDQIQHWHDIGNPDVNWSDELLNRNAISHDVNFSVSKGGEESSLYAGVGYNNSEGTIIESGFERLSGNVKYQTKLSDAFDLSISGMVSNVKSEPSWESDSWFQNPTYARYIIPPWQSPYLEDGSLDNTPEFNTYGGGIYNTVYIRENDDVENEITRGIQNTELNWKISDQLVFTSRLGMDFTLRYFNHYQNRHHSSGQAINGYKEERESRLFNYTTQNSLDYTFSLKDLHNFRVTAVQEFTKYKTKAMSTAGAQFPNDQLKEMNSASDLFSAAGSFTDRMNMRYVGLLNYDFDKRYLLNASYSYQGDSRFSERWGSFYSVGLGWNIHEENFMEQVDFVDELRLKLAYGETGNADIGINQYQALIGYGVYRKLPAAFVDKYGTDATWERSGRLDISADYSFFNNRLWGSVGVFNNETRDMLLEVPIPLSVTYYPSTILQNQGKMRNRGVELTINGDLIQTPDFNWSMGFNMATLDNKVTEMPEDGQTIADGFVIQEGHEAYEWYMPEWAGVDPDNGDGLWYVDRTESEETTNQFGQAKRQYIGKGRLPTYTGSLSTRLDYKGVFLEGQLYFSGGNKIYENFTNSLQTTGSQMETKNSSAQAFEGAWRKPGDQATYPRFDTNSANVDNVANQTSTRWLHDGDFMRLRNLAVGYTFDKKLLQDLPVDNVTLSVRGTNLWTWVKDKSLLVDPEVRTDGHTNLTAPPVKTVTFNVNINF